MHAGRGGETWIQAVAAAFDLCNINVSEVSGIDKEQKGASQTDSKGASGPPQNPKLAKASAHMRGSA